MQRDRNTEIKQRQNISQNRQQQNRRLEQQTKKMEQQLEKIKKIKQLENERIKMQKQLDSLNLQEKKQKNQIIKSNGLRTYGNQIKKKNQEKAFKKLLNKKIQTFIPSSQSQKQQADDGENLKYFLQVMGMSIYFQRLKNNNITSLAQLKKLKQTDLKQLDIPIKEQVKLMKKLRTMGI